MLKHALKGLRVLDLSRILAGPWCAQNLADMGADVIKVENPKGGDDTRQWGPGAVRTADGDDEISAYFASCNRGKRSITIDFSQSDGADLVRRLAARADILVENFKAGSLDKYGLDYATLQTLNPRLIYLSITGYGLDGPMAGRPGYDYVFQGFGGLLSYTGQPDGEPGAGPVRVGTSIVDLSTGLYGTIAVLGALQERQQTGAGAHIDLALSDVSMALNVNHNMSYLIDGQLPQRMGSAHTNLAPYAIFPCQDGHIILAVGNDAQFQRFCTLTDRPQLASDPRFATNTERLRHRASLRAIVIELLADGSCAQWGKRLDDAGIPWGPIHTVAQAFEHPQSHHRRLAQTLQHPLLGGVPTVRNPITAGDVSELRAPPLLGEHSNEIIAELRRDSDSWPHLRDTDVTTRNRTTEPGEKEP